MWKKDDLPTPEATGHRIGERTPRLETPRPGPVTGERATIGPSITIRGDVSGDEDLLIQGRVEGSVDLKLKSVTVGTEGRVKANITGRVVIVEGEVEGDLKAKEQVVLRSTARVQGDITAARVVLEDGASFRGGVDMGDPAGQGKQTAGSSPAQVKSTPESTKAPSESEKALGGRGKDDSGTTEKATS